MSAKLYMLNFKGGLVPLVLPLDPRLDIFKKCLSLHSTDIAQDQRWHQRKHTSAENKHRAKEYIFLGPEICSKLNLSIENIKIRFLLWLLWRNNGFFCKSSKERQFTSSENICSFKLSFYHIIIVNIIINFVTATLFSLSWSLFFKITKNLFLLPFFFLIPLGGP